MNDDIKLFLINQALKAIWAIDDVMEAATSRVSKRLYRAERKILASQREVS
jgi:hypothetical protein